MRLPCLLLLLLLVLASARSASAAETAARPTWMAARAPMPDLAHKTDGSFPDALPLIAYDTNTGLGLGVGAHLTVNGHEGEPLFAYTPYRHRVYAQAFATTGGFQQHILSYDGIAIAGTPLRLKAVATYERNTNANYFGNGEATLGPLTYGGQRFATYDAAATAAGPRYFHYGVERPQGQVVLERSFLGGLRAHYGVNVQHVDVTRYDSRAEFSPGTKLGIDCASGAAKGCGGGWNNLLRSGIAWDTRDYEPDPRSGVLLDATGQWSARGFGSSADYVRMTMAARSYVSPAPELADVVIATRVLYSVQSANVPFFAMSTLGMAAGTDDATDQSGLGGERTLRGFRQDRFVVHVAAAANAEVRWTFARFSAAGQRFSLQAAPLVDAGRVFDKVGFSLQDWKVAGGAGLRVGWNQSTIVMFDFGASREDTGFYVDFGMPF